jgi:cell division protein FtsW (lipid II flippase)
MLCAVVGFVLFAAGIPLRVLAMPVVAGALGAALYIAGSAVRGGARARLRRSVADRARRGLPARAVVSSRSARGGAFGVGLGNGLQKLSVPARGAHRLHPLDGRGRRSACSAC